MNKPTRHLLKITSTLVLVMMGFILPAQEESLTSENGEQALSEAKMMRFENPDSSILLLNELHAQALTSKDTALTIKTLINLAMVYGHQARYKDSYDNLWTALLLADAAKLAPQQATVYKAIGRHYSFYRRKEKAIEFLGKSLEINKRLVKEGKLDPASLVANYHSFVSTYRELDEPVLGRAYVDSCLLILKTIDDYPGRPYLLFEQAVLKSKSGRYQESLGIYEKIIPWFNQNNPSNGVLVYYYLGDSYRGVGNFAESERCYKKSLEIAQEYHSHIDFTPLVHERLSEVYFTQGEYIKAYNSLKSFKELDAVFFDSRSENNRPLLEIQDEYRNAKDKQVLMLRDQRLAQLEQEERVMFLENIILIGLIVFLVLFGILYFNYVRAKYIAEKLMIRKNRELEIQKSNEIVELKNKELAASALKLIEKDVFIEKLKDRICNGNGKVDQYEIKRIVGSMSSRSASNWKEFEARFVSVNRSFYENLSRQFPKLTQGDLKLCALVKLNFSSKEMAKLLGISIESVHTTRYRLRKKLKLSRDMNLTEFIANVGNNRQAVHQ